MDNKFLLTKHNGSKHSYLNILIVMLVGVFILSAYGLINIFQTKKIIVGYLLLFSALAIAINSIYLKVTKNEIKSTLLSVLICMLFLGSVILLGGTNKQALIWVLIIPLISFYTQGMKRGIFLSVIFAIYIIIVALLDYLLIITTPFILSEYMELFLLFSLISIMTYMYENTTEVKEEMILDQIFKDRLTGLQNRRKLLKDLDYFQSKSLFLLNVDDFKEINDLYGAKTGDVVICEIAKRLTEVFSTNKKTKIYKLHADEFAILLQGSLCKHDFVKISKTILQIFSDNFLQETYDLAITVSLGISDSERDILADTDIALKTAKSKRIPYVVFNNSMNASTLYRTNHNEVNRLKKGIAQDTVTTYFQPIVSNNSDEYNHIAKYECLVRLVDDNDIVSPFSFLELSKRAKLYPYITRIVIDKSFSHFDKSNWEFSINVCLDDMLNSETTTYIYNKIDEYQNGHRVVFELLESQKIEDRPEVLDFITQVKKRGCKIAIDDFGSGYSNFEYILRIKADYLKLDASLIKNINTDKNSQIIIETIVDFCRKLNIKTIAEFVHSEEVYKKVKEMGIDYSQGYHLGKPSPST